MKLVFIVSGEPLTITSHVSVVKNFLATDEIAGRDVIIWIIYIGIMIHRFRVEWSIGLSGRRHHPSYPLFLEYRPKSTRRRLNTEGVTIHSNGEI